MHLLHLTRGDDVLQCIRAEVQRVGIQTGVVLSGIGSLSSARYHYIDSTAEKPNDVFEEIRRPLELVSVQGLIIQGKPHLHALFSDLGRHCLAGHLEEGCEVLYVAEFCILETAHLPIERVSSAFGIITHFALSSAEHSATT